MSETITMSLKEVDAAIIARAKACAALRGQTLKAFVLDALQRALPEGIEKQLADTRRAERPARKGRRS